MTNKQFFKDIDELCSEYYMHQYGVSTNPHNLLRLKDDHKFEATVIVWNNTNRTPSEDKEFFDDLKKLCKEHYGENFKLSKSDHLNPSLFFQILVSEEKAI